MKGKDVIAELALGFPGVRQPFFEAVDSSEVAPVSTAVARILSQRDQRHRSLAHSPVLMTESNGPSAFTGVKQGLVYLGPTSTDPTDPF